MKKNEEGTSSELGDAPLAAPLMSLAGQHALWLVMFNSAMISVFNSCAHTAHACPRGFVLFRFVYARLNNGITVLSSGSFRTNNYPYLLSLKGIS